MNYILFWRAVSVIVLAILAGSCNNSPATNYEVKHIAEGQNGMVVSAHPLATEAGVDILRRGGNAIDAGIAVQLALAVVYPRAGNIGGGGFMVYRESDGTTATLDFRERAPMAAHRDMYLDSTGNVIPNLSLEGHLAAGVPGTVYGITEMHARYGSLHFSALVNPAIRLARYGYAITEAEARRLNEFKEVLATYNESDCPFIKEEPWAAGDVLVQADLASTMERIARSGCDEFYSGQTAEMIRDEMTDGGGLITLDDLSKYRSVWREPITTEYKNYTITSMGPPSSGGIALAQLLEYVEPFPIAEWGPEDVRTLHLMVEAERRAFADRAIYLGDPDYVSVPVDSLMDAEYIEARMSDFSHDSASFSSAIESGIFHVPLESYETTHLSVVDRHGNAVSITTTLNANFGCKVMVDGAGFFLNCEMDDFSVKPGVPNLFGLIGAEANRIQPGKRMLSSMTPTIVSRNDSFCMTLGASGGSTIITSVFQVFLNITEFEMTPSQAVGRPRFHHQWIPDVIVYEPGFSDPDVMSRLESMGHAFSNVKAIGQLELIIRYTDGRLVGAADPRSDDTAAGY